VTLGPRVLLVEDDAATREGYRQYLTGCGMAVTAVANGYEALVHASSAAPQVIVLDLGLPDIDGWKSHAVEEGAQHGRDPDHRPDRFGPSP